MPKSPKKKLNEQQQNTSAGEGSQISISQGKVSSGLSSISSQAKSKKDCLIALIVFLSLVILLLSIFLFSLQSSLTSIHTRIETMDLKFQKFLFYIKHIYKTQKNKQQQVIDQNGLIAGLLGKMTSTAGQKKENKFKVKTTYSDIQRNNKNAQRLTINEKQNLPSGEESKITVGQGQSKKDKKEIELLSEEEIIDIAMKIIQEEHEEEQSKVQENDSILSQQSNPQTNPNILTNQTKPSQQSTQHYICQIDPQNVFYRNFQYDSKTMRLRKDIFTSSFESMVCQDPIPETGTHQISIKILKSLKNFIYVGIAGGPKGQVYNITSLHENVNFYGYSGYSGRLWQGTKRKNAYEMFQPNIILKLKVNMDENTVSYYFGDYLLGQSFFGQLCQEECRFVVQMHNEGDQIQFLEPFVLNVTDVTFDQL